jgi:DNA-directed RNA polymerase specialized sigma24 family protein
MEDKERIKMYEELVAKYSKVYFKKVSSLFALSDLAQEIWIVLLGVEEENVYDADKGTSYRTFLIACIKNHMINLITKEIREKKTVVVGFEERPEVEDSTPNIEDLIKTKELLEGLKVKIKKIRYGQFVLDRIGEGYTVREISEIASEQGMSLSKSNAQKITQKIRKEISKLTTK